MPCDLPYGIRTANDGLELEDELHGWAFDFYTASSGYCCWALGRFHASLETAAVVVVSRSDSGFWSTWIHVDDWLSSCRYFAIFSFSFLLFSVQKREALP